MNIESCLLTKIKCKILEFKNATKEERMASPIGASIIIEKNRKKYRNSVVAWTDFYKRIHIYNEFFTEEDTFIYQILVHELVHVKQYENFWNMLWARSFGRHKSEEEATEIGEKAEIWIKVIHFK